MYVSMFKWIWKGDNYVQESCNNVVKNNLENVHIYFTWAHYFEGIMKKNSMFLKNQSKHSWKK